jgi:hypothetical protein
MDPVEACTGRLSPWRRAPECWACASQLAGRERLAGCFRWTARRSTRGLVSTFARPVLRAGTGIPSPASTNGLRVRAAAPSGREVVSATLHDMTAVSARELPVRPDRPRAIGRYPGTRGGLVEHTDLEAIEAVCNGLTDTTAALGDARTADSAAAGVERQPAEVCT